MLNYFNGLRNLLNIFESFSLMINTTTNKLPNYSDSHHLPDGHYQNEPGEPIVAQQALQTSGFFKSVGRFAKFFASKSDITTPIPVRKIDTSNEFEISDNSNHPLIRAWWIGHATVLIQINSNYIIIDPQLSDYASPVPGFIKRITPPALRVEDLPPISLILYSHDHYDHLSYETLAKIKERFPDVTIFAPLGIADMINGWNTKFNAHNFDWRTTTTITFPNSEDQVCFTCFPARHYTRRSVSDTNQRLWCSWLIQYNDCSLYHPGDSAIGPHFAEIRNFVGKPIDIAFMPIGPQNPPDVMRPVHMNPEDVKNMSEILEARCVIPIHYGCFALGQQVEVPDLVLLKRLWNGDNLTPIKVGGRIEYINGRFLIPENCVVEMIMPDQE